MAVSLVPVPGWIPVHHMADLGERPTQRQQQQQIQSKKDLAEHCSNPTIHMDRVGLPIWWTDREL